MRKFRVLGLLAVMAFIFTLALPPLWTALQRDGRVRPSDTAGTPERWVNPVPQTGTPGKPAPSPAEVTEILRSHGYLDVSNPRSRPDGSWTAEAAKEFNGRKMTVTVDRDGNIAEAQPSAPQGNGRP